MKLTLAPVVSTEMLIRRPTPEVYQAFVNPEITTRFWFTRSSGPLVPGARVRWDWEMYGVGTNVEVLDLRESQRIYIRWDEATTVEWVFQARADGTTLVTITNSGFAGGADEIVAEALDAAQGFAIVLCGAKAWLEHGLALKLVEDRAPDAHVPGWNPGRAVG